MGNPDGAARGRNLGAAAPATPVPHTGESPPARARAVYIGIDPGAAGGLAWIENGRIRCTSMPHVTDALWKWFQRWTNRPELRPIALVELVGGYVRGAEMKGDNGGAANGSRMFQFGRQYGEVLMGLTAAGISYKTVAPATWQASLFLKKTRDEASDDHKRRMADDARRRYPDLHVTLSTADAVLICTYLYKTGFSNV